MLLGKRRRSSMKRTTSMAEFASDLEGTDDTPMLSDQNIPATIADNRHQQLQNPDARQPCGSMDLLSDLKLSKYNRTSAVDPRISPRDLRRKSGDLSEIAGIETAPFLRSCGLCMRRLNPGRDIFMYRGEIAFCSLECRQQLMNQEERKEKCSFSSMKKHSAPATSAASDTSGTGEKVAAA